MPLPDTLLALLVSFIWGLNFVVMKVGVGELPPFTITALRFLLAALPAVFFVSRPRGGLGHVAVFALLFAVLKFSLVFSALRLGLSAGLTAVALQVQAVFTVAIAALVTAERLRRPQAAGMALAVAGLLLLALEQGGGERLLPLLMVVAAALAWAMANIVARQARGVEPLSLVVWSSAMAAPVLVALSVLFERTAIAGLLQHGVSWRAVGAVVYLAYPVNLISIVIWNALLRRHSTAAVAPFALLVPVIGALSGHLLLGEPLTRGLILGGALVIAGLSADALASRARAARTRQVD